MSSRKARNELRKQEDLTAQQEARREQSRRKAVRLVAVSGAILVVGGGIVALAVTRPEPKPLPVLATPLATNTSPITSSSAAAPFQVGADGTVNLGTQQTQAAGGRTPAPFEYDAENDQYWHAGHGHWHPGPPPQQATSTQQATNTPETTNTPKAWEYNPATDQHWNPDHGHWHNGPPPQQPQ